MNRRILLGASALAASMAFAGFAQAQELPALEQKDRYTVGFAQSESNNPWRIAETASFEAAAEECGWDLIMTDAGGSAAKQVADVDSIIAQGVDVLFLTPREEGPLIPAVMRAQAAGVPPSSLTARSTKAWRRPAPTTWRSSARTSSTRAAARPST
jgi:ribose transport system substrate-binding protein